MCNVSVVFADSNAPTECRISINNNALYTNNRYVTLELYGTDADPMQVWISNDGENGTVLDFAYGKTISITDVNYTVGVALTSSNSTNSTNSDNVLRIENWPLSSVNGTKKVYAVFRDAYGNKTSVNGLSTITITYDLNTLSGTTPSAVTTVKNLGVYTPNIVSSVLNKSFTGWSDSKTATVANYSANSMYSFNSSTTLYAICSTLTKGDYIYYNIDRSKSYAAPQATTGTAKTYSMSTKFTSTPAVFRVLSASTSSITIMPDSASEVFDLVLYETTGYYGGVTAINSICALYSTNYSSSVTCATTANLSSASSVADMYTFCMGSFYRTSGWRTVSDGGGYWHGELGIIYKCADDVDELDDRVTVTHKVCPIITLKTNITISGKGNSSNPYTITLK